MAALLTGPAPAPPAAATVAGDRIFFGLAGEAEVLTRATGEILGDHNYGRFHSEVPAGRMLSVDADVSWARVAAVQPGSTLYDDIARWGRVLKDRGVVFLAFSHEPEISGNRDRGTPEDFKRAFRRVVQIMRAEGATNVEYTWQMTAWSFRTDTSDYAAAHRWYPGDDVVDVVGADAYNWGSCGEGQGRWVPLSTLASGALQFARDHGKQLSLPEYGSHRDARRAEWFRDAQAWMVANKGRIAAAYYFNRLPTNLANSDCRWTLTSDAELAAVNALVQDTANFRS